MFDYTNKDLDAYAITDVQIETLKAYREHGTIKKAAESLGKNTNSVNQALYQLQKKFNESETVNHDVSVGDSVPVGFHIKGVSTMVHNAEGKPMWIKTDADKAAQAQGMMDFTKALADTIPPVQEVPLVQRDYKDMLAVYPLGDPHIGMMAWEPESGADWDINIAKEKFTGVFDRLVKTAPHCEECLIVNLGDYFHADNMEGITTRSGHSLDLDGRFSKMIDAGVFVIRRMVESALVHHKKVSIMNTIGNHDDTGAQWLSVVLSAVYENNDRVNVLSSPAPFQYFEFGKVLIGSHHGHTCKMDRLPMVMAADMAKEWGRTEFRYWLTGHIHHDSMKEFAGVKCESFRTLAAKDAYAAWGGYRSGQDSKCLVMHREYGEVERHTVNIAMLD